MVQFIPSAPGTTAWAPQRPSLLEQIGPLLSGAGQAMGGADANGNQTGIAAVLQAMHQRQPLQQFLKMPPTPDGQASPLGPMGQVPVNRIKQMQDITGKTGISSILNNSSNTTLYMEPTTGGLSMTQTPGSIPIGGYKGPAAAAAVGHSKHEQLMNDHIALADKLKAATADASLSAEDKKIVALARINAQALSNPMADFSDDDQAMMRETLKKANAILSKSAGIGADKSSFKPGEAGGKKNISEADYKKLKKGQKFMWDGQELTKQ